MWIEEATLAGDVLLCKDLAIAKNPLEAQVVYMTSARVFGLSNASITGPMMAQWYLDNEARIVRAALGSSQPELAGQGAGMSRIGSARAGGSG